MSYAGKDSGDMARLLIRVFFIIFATRSSFNDIALLFPTASNTVRVIGITVVNINC